MKKDVYRVRDLDSSSQQQSQGAPISYYQSTANFQDGAVYKSEHGTSEATLSKGAGVKPSSKTNGKDENTHLNKNGASNVPSNGSQTVPEYPFSLARVWVSITVIIVLNIVVVAVIQPLLSQYLFQYFLEESMQFINTTFNSTNASTSCAHSTDSENDAINSVQKQASNIYLYSNIVINIPAFFMCLFVGSISDVLGRRCLLIGSVLGAIIKTSILCIVIKLKLDIQLIYIGCAVEGLMGSYYSTTLTIAAIITDITQDESSKAVRFAIIEGLILVFGAVTQLAVGYLIEKTGFFVPVLMCDCILVIPLLLIIFMLPETLPEKGKFSWNIWKHIKKTFGFYYSSVGGNRRRFQFIAGLAAYFTIIFTLTGKVTIEVLFELTRPICWNSVDIGIFNSARMGNTAGVLGNEQVDRLTASAQLGSELMLDKRDVAKTLWEQVNNKVAMSVAAVIILRLCKGRVSLEMIGVICGISSIGGFVFMAFANSTLLVYLSGLVGILYMTALIPPRTILSQQASPSEQGALFSSLACTEAIASMVSSTVYILIYNATLDTFKGATFLVIAGMSLIYTILQGIMTCLRTSTNVDYENHIEGPIEGKTSVSSDGHNSSKL